MKRLPATFAAIAALVTSALASAQTLPTLPTSTLEQRVAIASGMCHQSVALAVPVGEADIQDSSKFDAYCSCFGDFIAPKGTFELFPVGARVPATCELRSRHRRSRQTMDAPVGVAMTLAHALDPRLAEARDGHAARGRTLVLDPSTHSANLDAAHLSPGQAYVAVVSTADAALKHTGFASRTFVAS